MILYVWFAVMWCLGLIFCFSSTGKLIIGMIVLGLFFSGCFFLKRRVILLALAFILGMGWAWIDQLRHNHPLGTLLQISKDDEVALTVRGKVDSFPVVDGDRLRFFLLAKEVEYRGKNHTAEERVWVSIHLQSPAEKNKAYRIVRGDILQIRLTLSIPSPPSNPGAFDFPHYLWQNYTSLTAKATGLNHVTIVASSSLLGWRTVAQMRQFLEEQIEQIFSPGISGVMKGILLGEQREVPIEIEEIYRNAGILHILAISGSHVMILIAGLFFLLSSLRLTRERIYELLFLFIPLYMLLTGLTPSVVRAGLMGMFYLLAKRLHLNYSATRAITVVFLLLTLVEPRVLYNIGFQLSFFVTAGLIFFTRPLARRIGTWVPFLPEKLAYAIAACIIAEFLSFPIIAHAFHQIPLSSLWVNLVILPFFSLLIPWGYLSLLLAIPSPTLGKWTAFPLNGAVDLLHRFLDFATNRPMLILSVASQPLWWWVIFGLLFLMLSLPRPGIINPIRYRLFALLLVFLLFLPLMIARFDQTVKITFIDVGQGDCILIQGPNQHAVLIDGGGVGYQRSPESWQIRRDPFEVGKDVVVPALRSLGVSRLDWVVLSHGDGDHIGGLRAVIDQLPVGQVLVNGIPPSTELEKELIAFIKEKEIPIKIAKRGKWMSWNRHISIDIVSPSGYLDLKEGDNNASIVLQLNANGRTFLFTGDLEADGERELLKRMDLEHIDVLKVGHHGSKSSTSEEFLSMITPKAAIISVGKNNRYGHPAREVLDRLKAFNVQVFRTDQHGAITFTIHNKGKVTYKSWLGISLMN